MTFVPSVSYALNAKAGYHDGEDDFNLVAETVRSHPRPGSNSNGNLVATSITLASDPISAHELAQPSTKRNGDPGVVQQGASVRRLTPTECERLQGLHDDWTNPDGTAPDSRRYAGLGDAVTATVGHWLGARIRAADEAAA